MSLGESVSVRVGVFISDLERNAGMGVNISVMTEPL